MNEEVGTLAVVWTLSATVTAGLAWWLIGAPWALAAFGGWLLVLALFLVECTEGSRK